MTAPPLPAALVCACLAGWPWGQARASDDTRIVACDTLIALRLLTASVDDDRARAAARVAEQPACHLVPRDTVGEVEHRAMIGGAPFECLSVKGGDTKDGGSCLWVQP